MLDWFIIVLTIALGAAGGEPETAVAKADPPAEQTTSTAEDVTIGADVMIGEDVVIGDDVVISGGVNLGAGMIIAEDEEAVDTSGGLTAGMVLSDDASGQSSAPQFEAEPQTPTGKFTTASEIKSIMEMTKPNWVAVSAQPGNDFLYVTHIWSWRCGLLQMKVSLNGGPMEVWPLPPCHEGTNAPNAIIESDGLPFKMYAPGEISAMQVELLLDDLTEMSASYARSDVLLP